MQTNYRNFNDLYQEFKSNKIAYPLFKELLKSSLDIGDLIKEYAVLSEKMTHITYAIQSKAPGVRIMYSPNKTFLQE